MTNAQNVPSGKGDTAQQLELFKMTLQSVHDTTLAHFKSFDTNLKIFGLYIAILTVFIGYFSFSTNERLGKLEVSVAVMEQRLGVIERDLNDVKSALRLIPDISDDIAEERQERENLLQQLRDIVRTLSDEIKIDP